MGRKEFKYQTITKCIALLYVLLFTYAATSKLLDMERFIGQLGRFPYISDYAKALAWGVPTAELLVVVLYLFPKYTLAALYASLWLMVAFTIYIALVLRFSNHVPCACGGVLSQLGWTEHLVFNLVFVLFAVLGIYLKNQQQYKCI
ncbi:MauE/DoxX family redox-associated membrane protein [Flavisericum labens]|uniref:MauE/DoxX family redox-associated membrane protein n=1 Tax=Flavisericum labens TaxID=3377112 RepID=UPI00387B354B